MAIYLRPHLLSKAEALGLKARSIVEGLRVGDHKSPFRGFSVEFVQHREYTPGDDIRHIDWKGYGRSERYTIKQYEQETNYIGTILLDASRSMLYGEGDTNKLEFAKLLTATISYVIIKQRDSVALNIFDSRLRKQLPASSQMGHLTTICHTLEETEPEEKSSIGPIIQQVAERIRRRGMVFIISDAFDEVEPLLKSLSNLRFQGHEVTLFHIMHRDEIEFPFTGNIRFDGMEIPEELKTRPQLIRPTYMRVVQEYLTQLKQGCEANRVDYVLMDTTRPLELSLSEYLVRRLQLARM